MLESVATARIEGNHTTVLEYVNSKIDDLQPKPYGIREICNLENALQFIEQNANYPINRMFISQLHKMIMDGLPLDEEGDVTPGEYRKENVAILKSVHQPPDAIQVNDYMEELLDFINKQVPNRFELLKTAIAHHRFVWIHPFTNGNGRTARLLTYAMLVKYGFAVESGRIVNPAAVFCSTREEYYNNLGLADESLKTGNKKGMLQWCEYMLTGIKRETDNINRLTDYNFVKTKLLLPTFRKAKDNAFLSSNEYLLLEKAAQCQMPFRAGDVKDVFSRLGAKNATLLTSRTIKSLRDKKILVQEKDNNRAYYIQFDNNPLLRGLLQAMDEAGILPIDPNS
ncbi:MAG: Fic family protein [Thermoguttaceae bacterium]|nr:Fic family protein [Thermoguttaceae bacterium]